MCVFVKLREFLCLGVGRFRFGVLEGGEVVEELKRLEIAFMYF